MIGNRDVLVAERYGGLNHGLDAVAAIAPLGVHMEITADIGT
jgi:hypothetical protein